MSTPDLTKLEAAVMGRFLEGDDPVRQVLRQQLDHSTISAREYSGEGFFVEFEVDRSIPPAQISTERMILQDVQANIDGLQHGAGFILFVTGGYLDMLEGFSFEEPWPSEINSFEVQR